MIKTSGQFLKFALAQLEDVEDLKARVLQAANVIAQGQEKRPIAEALTQ